MYKNGDSLLLVKPCSCSGGNPSAWVISASTSTKGGWIESGRATNSPLSPAAGPSVRLRRTWWTYWDGSADKKADITLKCIKQPCPVAATIVLSSTASAAENTGNRLGEYVEADSFTFGDCDYKCTDNGGCISKYTGPSRPGNSKVQISFSIKKCFDT